MDSRLTIGKRYCKIKQRKTNSRQNNTKAKHKKEKLSLNKAKSNVNDLINDTKKTKNLTKKRLLLKHGLFAKGTRSDTVTRIGLSEEFKARSEENLNKIIDLANVSCKNVCTWDIRSRAHKIKQADSETIQCNINNVVSQASPCVSQIYSLKDRCISPSENHNSSQRKSPSTALRIKETEDCLSLSSTSDDSPCLSRFNETANLNMRKLYVDFTTMTCKAFKEYLPQTKANLCENIKIKLKNIYQQKQCNSSLNHYMGDSTKLRKIEEHSIILDPIKFLNNTKIDKNLPCKSNKEVTKKCQNIIKCHNNNRKNSPENSFIEGNCPEEMLEILPTCEDTPEHLYLPRRFNFNKQ